MADSPEETSEECSDRLAGLDLGELERVTATMSASSASDAVNTAGSLEVAADRPSPASAGAEFSDTSSERAVSVRAAVADSFLVLGIDISRSDAAADDTKNAESDTPVKQSPRTLTELEAVLPGRS